MLSTNPPLLTIPCVVAELQLLKHYQYAKLIEYSHIYQFVVNVIIFIELIIYPFRLCSGTIFYSIINFKNKLASLNNFQ